MANLLYTPGKEGMLDGTVIWTSSNIKAMLVAGSLYTVNATTHNALDDIPAGARIASTSVNNRTATGGVADCDNVSFTLVPALGVDATALVFYVDTGDAATSRLIGYFDTLTGLPFTPNNGSASVTINAGGLFSL